MRGEDFAPSASLPRTNGSPPHAQGRRTSGVCRTDPPRITPACAGKTTCQRVAVPLMTDHPRMRGEDTLGRYSMYSAPGSPPHARGRHELGLVSAFLEGITPACAGKT